MRKLLFPGPVVIPDQQEQAGEEKQVVEEVSQGNAIPYKKEVKINTQCHIEHHPCQAKKE